MKNKACHNVDRSEARFGVADGPELCKLIADSIPEETLRNAEHILDVGSGCCGISRAIVNRLVKELDVPFHDAILRMHGVDIDLALVNKARRLGFIQTLCVDFLEWQPEMKFDVIVGNPPYNNAGKIKGQRQTSGTSLWLQFLRKTPQLLKEGGWCSLLVPAAVGNTNSQGWKALGDYRVESVGTGLASYFKVGTSISCVTFSNNPPQSGHLVNGEYVERSLLPLLPERCDRMSLSIFQKVCSFRPMVEWQRDNWPIFEEKSAGKNVVGMSFLDRSKYYKVQTFDELNKRALKKVNICWMETDSPEALIRLMTSKLFSFFAEQTMLSGNLSVGMVRCLSVPDGWESLSSDEEIYTAYGLTEDEIEYIEGVR
jgi:hypothetical protein